MKLGPRHSYWSQYQVDELRTRAMNELSNRLRSHVYIKHIQRFDNRRKPLQLRLRI